MLRGPLPTHLFSVAFIICRLLFDVPDAVLTHQLQGAGFDLDLWLQQTLVTAGSNLMGFSDALDYLSERRGLWGLLKTAIRPNPLRKVSSAIMLCSYILQTLFYIREREIVTPNVLRLSRSFC